MFKLKINNIIFKNSNNNNEYQLLANNIQPHFTAGLIIDGQPSIHVTYLYLSNPTISKEQLFDEYWNFREKHWFQLPAKIIKQYHLALKYQ